jgi:hypothetical protein
LFGCREPASTATYCLPFTGDPGDAWGCFDQRRNDRSRGRRLFTVRQPAAIDGLSWPGSVRAFEWQRGAEGRDHKGRQSPPSPDDSERQRPRDPAYPAAKPRKVKDYSERVRKPELRRTAWWSWQDSNQPTSNYAGLGRGAASVRETQHLMLTPPRDRRVEEAGDTDPLGQSTVDSSLDEAPGRKASEIVIWTWPCCRPPVWRCLRPSRCGLDLGEPLLCARDRGDELDPGVGADRTGYVGLSRCREIRKPSFP